MATGGIRLFTMSQSSILFAAALILVWKDLSTSAVAPFTENEMYFIEKEERKPCTYFLGKERSGQDARKSRPESGLVNCTWYKDGACCRRTEVTSVFSKMYPLNLASRRCRNLINYMLCYWCSPLQYKWYYKRLFVCKEFCDQVYEECGRSTWNNQELRSKYRSGSHFCEAQKFEVVATQPCFDFDETIFDCSSFLHSSGTILFLAILIQICYIWNLRF